MRQPNLSTELLKTFVTVVEVGGFIKAAEHLYKTQSTISQQIRKLEEEIGVALFKADGRKRVLTAAGERLLSYAKRLLALQDETLMAVAQAEASTTLRIGVSHSLTEGLLPEVLRRFMRAYPQVHLVVEAAYTTPLIAAYDRGDYDILLTQEREPTGGDILSAHEPVWIGREGSDWPEQQPVPLAMFHGACEMRQIASHAFDQAGIGWQVVYGANSLSALLAAVRAGLAITLRTRHALAAGTALLTPPAGLMALPAIHVVLRYRPETAAHERLAKVFRSSYLTAL